MGQNSRETSDLTRAEEILDRDHYGLEQVKERMLEFLAVRALTKQGESPIICLVGPPGTGKTSIARSVAEALNKNTSASALAVCGMRRRFGDTEEPMSARCPDGLSMV